MDSAPVLKVKIRHRQAAALTLDARFTIDQPWTLLFGPSGSGKTSLLRAIAGFLRPDSGRILFGGEPERPLTDTTAGIFVPPHLRPVRSAGQQAKLFPALTVRQNIEYGTGWRSRRRGAPSEDLPSVVRDCLELLRVAPLANRRPADLSGGESQRVSVARAVLAAVTFRGPGKPLLLLDEPFSGLDAALRDQLAPALQAWLRRWQIPVLSVSHDIAEAFLLNAEVIRMTDGKILEQGPARKVLASEKDRLLHTLTRTEQPSPGGASPPDSV